MDYCFSRYKRDCQYSEKIPACNRHQQDEPGSQPEPGQQGIHEKNPALAISTNEYKEDDNGRKLKLNMNQALTEICCREIAISSSINLPADINDTLAKSSTAR